MLEVNAIGTFNGTLAALERDARQRLRPRHQRDLARRPGRGARRGRPTRPASTPRSPSPSAPSPTCAARVKGIDVSAVCPDGIWSPMLEDKLDDPDAAASFSGTMLTPEQVAERIDGLLDRRGRCSRSRAGAAPSSASSTPSPASLPACMPLVMTRRPPPPGALQAEGSSARRRGHRAAREHRGQGAARPAHRAGRFHTARGPMPLSGLAAATRRAWRLARRGRRRSGPGSCRRRSAGSAPDPPRLVGARARRRAARRLGSRGAPGRCSASRTTSTGSSRPRERLRELGLENVELRQLAGRGASPREIAALDDASLRPRRGRLPRVARGRPGRGRPRRPLQGAAGRLPAARRLRPARLRRGLRAARGLAASGASSASRTAGPQACETAIFRRPPRRIEEAPSPGPLP